MKLPPIPQTKLKTASEPYWLSVTLWGRNRLTTKKTTLSVIITSRLVSRNRPKRFNMGPPWASEHPA